MMADGGPFRVAAAAGANTLPSPGVVEFAHAHPHADALNEDFLDVGSDADDGGELDGGAHGSWVTIALQLPGLDRLRSAKLFHARGAADLGGAAARVAVGKPQEREQPMSSDGGEDDLAISSSVAHVVGKDSANIWEALQKLFPLMCPSSAPNPDNI
eukprot:gene32181-34122_t